MHQRTIRWRGSRVHLVYSIDVEGDGKRLTLHDVRAATTEVANAVPDWRIESEAMDLAAENDAVYM